MTDYQENTSTNVENEKVCPHCGAAAQADAAFCQGCGAALSSEGGASLQESPKHAAKVPFRLPKKLIAKGGAIIAVVLIAVIVLSTLFGGNSASYAFYFKDGELFCTSATKISPWQVTRQLLDMEEYYDDEEERDEDLAENPY